MTTSFDLICIGGGFANLWIALELRSRWPNLRVLVLEREPRWRGRQTWCFQRSDIPPLVWSRLEPYLRAQWSGYFVRFPDHSRFLKSPYACIQSGEFFERAALQLGESLHLGEPVLDVRDSGEGRCVVRTPGREWSAPMVLDGRGFPEGNPLGLRGFQCFLGEEVQLQKPHGLSDPIVMDASVAQRDGFRFFYLLPFDSARLLIEDTRYTERPPQDWSDYRKGIQEFLDLRGWSVLRKFREESEALPIPLWAEDMRQNRSDEANSRVISVGVRGGFFHPTTGYSIPDAGRVAEAVRESGIGPHTALRIRKVAQKRSRSPYCLLNRMMYLGTPAADRFRLLERFYRLPEESVARFYRSEMRGVDWLRLFGGRKPPLPILRAIRCAIARPGRREVWQHAWN